MIRIGAANIGEDFLEIRVYSQGERTKLEFQHKKKLNSIRIENRVFRMYGSATLLLRQLSEAIIEILEHEYGHNDAVINRNKLLELKEAIEKHIEK